ncbi:MAG TPA: adenylate/guanylate cyclase domain-containing protein [Trueperaceae bacterium]|nr:adenylate/guanylate cyclase domain-containing protein [Trueperaceae bacterium]
MATVCPTCGTENPDVMSFCGMCGGRLSHELTARERRQVSVLFIDLAGFSTLSQSLDLQEVRDLIDEVLTIEAHIIETYDGHVDAFKGDGLIALFGAPNSHPDDPHRAVLAAAASLDAIRAVGRNRGLALEGRAAVNTGVAIAGAIGSGQLRRYTVMGSAVNLAARLEAAAPASEVWVGEDTYEATRDRFRFEEAGPLQLAGFPTVRRAYRLLSTVQRRESDPYASLPLIGRDAELARLRRAHEEVRQAGTPRVLWLTGPAGYGKTRLMHEFVLSLGGAARTLWIDVRPTETFSWQLLEHQLFGTSTADDERTRQGHAIDTLERLLPGAPQLQRTLLSSLALAHDRGDPDDDPAARHGTNLAWRDLLVALTRPPAGSDALVVAVDNEPRDEALLAFLAMLKSVDAPILVLRTSRSETVPDGERQVQVGPLAPAEALELVREVGGRAAPASAEAVLAQLGGVPAYVLEVGRALSLVPDGDFPAGLGALLQLRLDSVETRARLLLAHAALVGEVVWGGLLNELAGGGGGPLVRTLVEHDLLLEEISSSIANTLEYRFPSELLRQAAVHMVPYSDRPLLHLRIATWLDQHAPPALGGLVGAHFEQGGSPEAAFASHLRAAELAAERGDEERADALFEHLLGLWVGSDLLCEGALSYARTALDRGDCALAGAQLDNAASWILRCPPDRRSQLERAERELRAEMERVAVVADADAGASPAAPATAGTRPDGDVGAARPGSAAGPPGGAGPTSADDTA